MDTYTRKAVNLTVRKDILEDAKTLGLNLSRAAEEGIAAALKKKREEDWLRENKKAIEAYNRFVEDEGILVRSYWLDES